MVTTGSTRTCPPRVTRLRDHGQEPKYYCQEVGGNFRLDELQAAVLRVKLRHLDDWTEARQRRRRRLPDRLLDEHDLAGVVGRRSSLPAFSTSTTSSSSGFRRPSATRSGPPLGAGIGTEIYYPIPLHLQVCFASLATPRRLPVAEAAAHETIALPIYAELTDAEQRYVVGSIRQFIDEFRYPSRKSDRAA